VNLPSLAYDLVFTYPLTRYTYLNLWENIKPEIANIKTVLDVGTGNGHALESIIDHIPSSVKILGIDIHKDYVLSATKRLKNRNNVEIKEKNFYSFENSKERFDLIIFSSSFMLMPFREKAIEVAT